MSGHNRGAEIEAERRRLTTESLARMIEVVTRGVHPEACDAEQDYWLACCIEVSGLAHVDPDVRRWALEGARLAHHHGWSRDLGSDTRETGA